MAESQSETVAATGDELFDRYTLPKVALTIILLASLVGTYLTLRLGGTESLVVVLAKWVYLVMLGVLVGGLCKATERQRETLAVLFYVIISIEITRTLNADG